MTLFDTKTNANPDDGILELIAFRIGEQEFCIDVMCVREIRGWTPATALPHAPPFMRGVINLRGIVLSIVDLAACLGFAAAEPSARHVIIVVEIGGQTVGLLVDAVSDIFTVPRAELQATPAVASELSQTFVQGVLAIDDRMISLICVERICPNLRDEAA